MFDLEKINLEDLKAFWAYVKSLRKTRKQTIPREVYIDDEGTVSDDSEDIMRVWARDFGSLLTPPPMTEAGLEFLEQVKAEN